MEIIFEDNGIGFEQQYAKQIFTLVQRLHNKETFMGTGIGLALAKKLLKTIREKYLQMPRKIRERSFILAMKGA